MRGKIRYFGYPKNRSHQENSQTDSTKESNNFHLSEKQKKYIKIGAAVAVSGLAIYGGYKISKIMRNKKALIDLAAGAISTKSINPHMADYKADPFDRKYFGSTMNCGNCMIAQELTLRGQPSMARLNSIGMLPESMGKYFKGIHSGTITMLDLGPEGNVKNSDNLFNIGTVQDYKRGAKVRKLIENHIKKSYPENSRGGIYLPSINGNHWVPFRNVNGKIFIDNPQDDSLDLDDFFKYVVTKGTPGADKYGIRFFRFDDLQVDYDAVKEVVTNSVNDLSDNFDAGIIYGKNFVMDILAK